MCDAAELPALLARDAGLVWVDVPVWDEQAEQTLRSTFGFHPLAVRDSANRNQVPKIHRYEDHLFLVLHAPQPGAGGHVHYVELDQFIGDRYLVTVHGPLNPAVDQASAMVEVDTVLGRLTSGKLKPDRAFELSYALLTALTGRLRGYTAELTKDVWKLEQRVTGGHLGDPESFLDEMFRVRHGLLTVSTMSALSREVQTIIGMAAAALVHSAINYYMQKRRVVLPLPCSPAACSDTSARPSRPSSSLSPVVLVDPPWSKLAVPPSFRYVCRPILGGHHDGVGVAERSGGESDDVGRVTGVGDLDGVAVLADDAIVAGDVGQRRHRAGFRLVLGE